MSRPVSESCIKNGECLITSIPSTFCLLIIIFISTISTRKLRNKHQIQTLIKAVHYTACASSIICVIGLIISICSRCAPELLEFHRSYIVQSIALTCYKVLIISVVWTLFIRTHYAFKDSVFSITKCQARTIIFICILFVFIINQGFRE